jgi:hypothetical protein
VDVNNLKTEERLNFCRGSVMIRQPSFVGEFGTWVQNELTSFTNVTYNFMTSYYYDLPLTIATTLEHALIRGVEFEHWDRYREIFKEVRITGTTGFIELEKDTNNRHLGTMDIVNLQKSAENGEFRVATVGSFNPRAATIWAWTDPGIIYQDGTPVAPPQAYTIEGD